MLRECTACHAKMAPSKFYTNDTKSGRTSMCKDCLRARALAYREKNLDRCRAQERSRKQRPSELSAARGRVQQYRRDYPERIKAGAIVTSAIRNGTLRRPASCSNCGGEGVRLDAHHFDYSAPLKVLWLCRPCHARLHQELRRAAADPGPERDPLSCFLSSFVCSLAERGRAPSQR